MPTRSRLVAPWILSVTGALGGCGDDAPAGMRGSGDATTSASGGSTSTSTGQCGAGSGHGGDAGQGGDTGQGGVAGHGGDGGQGGETGGGGAFPARHPVELALRALPEDGDRGVVQVLVNDADGALVERLFGDDLPVQRDLEDGWTVTLLEASSWASQIASVRVTPEVDRIEHFASLEGQPIANCTFGAPMELTFQVPAVPGAHEIRIQTSVAPQATVVEPGAATVDVAACDDQESLTAVAVARDENGEVVGLELLAAIPYVPGGTWSHDLTLPPPARSLVAIDVGDIDGASTAHADATWYLPASAPYPGLFIEEPQHVLTVEGPSPGVSYAPSLLAPGIGIRHLLAVVATTHDGGWCSARRIDHRGGFGGPTWLELGALRRPVLGDETGAPWTWDDGGGTVGDVLIRTWTVPTGPDPYPGPARDILWTLADDPRAPPRPAVLPALPGDLPPQFEEPTGALAVQSIRHEDDEATAGYADAVRAVSSTQVHTTRSRSTRPCR